MRVAIRQICRIGKVGVANLHIRNPAGKTLASVRLTEDRLSTYKAAAEAKGVTFSAWVRGALDREAGN